MTLLQVTVSGTVGKQVFSSTLNQKAKLCGILVTPSGANATIKIRDGNASGEVVLFARALSAFGTKEYEVEHYFTKGMHVKIIGANAEAYLVYE